MPTDTGPVEATSKNGQRDASGARRRVVLDGTGWQSGEDCLGGYEAMHMIRKGQLVGARRGTFLPKTMSLLICSDWWHCPLARGLAHPQTVFATKDYRQASRP